MGGGEQRNVSDLFQLGKTLCGFEYSILNILSLDCGLLLIVARCESVDPETDHIVCIWRKQQNREGNEFRPSHRKT